MLVSEIVEEIVKVVVGIFLVDDEEAVELDKMLENERLKSPCPKKFS